MGGKTFDRKEGCFWGVVGEVFELETDGLDGGVVETDGDSLMLIIF